MLLEPRLSQDSAMGIKHRQKESMPEHQWCLQKAGSVSGLRKDLRPRTAVLTLVGSMTQRPRDMSELCDISRAGSHCV